MAITLRKNQATGGKMRVYANGRAIPDSEIPNVLFTECNTLRNQNTQLSASNDQLTAEIERLNAQVESLADELEECQTELTRVYTGINRLKEHTQSGIGLMNHLLKG